MDVQLIDLPWLPPAPHDFRQQVRALSACDSDACVIAQKLAGYRLTCNQAHMLAQPIAELAAVNPGRVRLGVLANGTADLLLPALSVSALRHGLWVEVVGTTTFDQVVAQALQPDSELNRAHCRYVLLSLDHRGLPMKATPGNAAGARVSVNAALVQVAALRRGLHENSDCIVIVQTLPQVRESVFGSLERTVPGTWQWLIDAYNRELRDSLAGSGDLLLDTAALAEAVGLAQWHDRASWALGKFPFALDVVPIYADHVARLMAAARGKARKCLVLDLDNTLWGGIVGDDGPEGIAIGNGSAVGEAHLHVQQTALALRERGIVLAVCSKNDEQVARSVFRSHPEMLLHEEHIAVFQVNWQDKAANLRAIAESLNLGVDALVLLDDSAAERAQVREALPVVAVPELPDDPALFGDTLLAAGYFEAIAFTDEDRRRADQYGSGAARASVLVAASDLASYLRSLNMKLVCGTFDPMSAARVEQLVNKTNQFNLTTRRYTRREVDAFEQSPSAHTLQARLIDRFGDNGIIAVVICIAEGRDWVIDTWLMSCRVLNRGVEHALLGCLVERAGADGVRWLIGEYRPTQRNGMVAGHYARLGFQRLSEDETGSSWRLDVATYVPSPVSIQVMDLAVTTPAPQVARPAQRLAGVENPG